VTTTARPRCAVFVAEDHVDTLTLTTVPVRIGQGRRPFGPLPADRGRRRTAATRAWDFGFEQTTWERVR